MTRRDDDFLRTARLGLAPDDGAKARVQRRIAAVVAAGTATGTAAQAAATSGTSAVPVASSVGPALAKTWIVRVVIASMLVGGAGGAVHLGTTAHSREPGRAAHVMPPHSPASESAPLPLEAVVPAPVIAAADVRNESRESSPPAAHVTPTREPRVTVRALRSPSASVPESPAVAAPAAVSPTPPSDTLSIETALLARARAALRDGDPGASLQAIEEHAVAWPEGALAEDRDTLRVLALCAVGREADARAAASSLLAGRPTSVHRARIDASCASTSPDHPSGAPP